METRFIDVENNSNSLGFSIQEENDKPWWNCVDHNKKPLYIVSNQCGTCPAVFKLLKGTTEPLIEQPINELLNDGFSQISEPVVGAISLLLASGKYIVSLQRITPRYSRINNRDVDYNWVNRLDTPYNDGFLSESIYPIIPEHMLNENRIRHYYYLPYTSPTIHPVALTLSFMVDRYPGGKGRYVYVGHVLLDGHHKLMAASWRGDSISILSFWVTNSFVSDLTDKSADEFIRSLYLDH